MPVMNKKLAAVFILGSLGYANVAMADDNYEGTCRRVPDTPTIIIGMDAGRIIVPVDTPKGAVIYRKIYDNPYAGKGNYECKHNQTVKFTATYVGSEQLISEDIRATNIKGIGIRVSRVGGKLDLVYPGSVEQYGLWWSLSDAPLQMELIKTDDTTGSGALRGGQYTSYGAPIGSPIMESYMSEGGTTIVSPSCKVTSLNTINVAMPDVNVSNFKYKGAMAGNKDFSIDIKCEGSTSVTGHFDLNATFSGTNPVNYDTLSGVLVNEYSDSDAAKGIGFKITTNEKPLAFNTAYLVNQNQGGEGEYSFPLTARYYQYDTNVSPGRVHSTMTYTITYN